MTEPGIGAVRFLLSCLVGVQLGLLYGFLRPLRPRHTLLSDLLFLPALGLVFLYVGFGICGGDLRVGCFLGLAVGGIAWEQTAGRLLRPIFAFFWKMIRRILDFFRIPAKKISKKIKFYFATWRKSVTIEWYYRRNLRRRTGGDGCGKREEAVRQGTGGVSSQFPGAEDHDHCAYRVLYHRHDGPVMGKD